MKTKAFFFALLLLFTGAANAQWQTTTYTLKGGWNAIYLHGDMKYGNLDALFPTQVEEIWRWNPNPNQVGFIESPLIPSSGTPEWTVYRRGIPADTTLTQLTGQAAYLVKCSGSASNTYTAALKNSPLPPAASWVRAGANLVGFPTFKNGSNYPLFSNYFATFPAAIAANTKIFKYVGGDLGAGNPLQIFSPAVERLDRTQAYWFSSEVVGNFYAPIEISSETSNGISFGSSGTVVTVRVRNRSSAAITLTIAPVSSEAAPTGLAGIAGPVPIARRTFNAASATWTDTPITASYTEPVGPLSTVELKFGLNRSTMTAPVGSLYASFLRLTDSGNLVDSYLPVSALRTALTGLWLGDITLTNVSSQVSNSAKAKATFSGGQVTALAVDGTGGFGYTTAPSVTIEPPISGAAATATATVANGSIIGFTMTSGGSGYTGVPRVTIAAPPPLPGSSVPRSYPVRTIMHVDANSHARLLSQVFIGQLASAPYDVGLCTRETLLKQDSKATAQRLVAATMPLDRVITCTGTVAVPQQITATVVVPFDDPTNPFVHQYHPDHDNKDARFTANLGNKEESHSVSRQCTFTFTTVPPVDGTSIIGWGTSVIGGYYTEVVTGLHKNPIQLSGYFELRRASENPVLTTP